jgi:hypothetical protein
LIEIAFSNSPIPFIPPRPYGTTLTSFPHPSAQLIVRALRGWVFHDLAVEEEDEEVNELVGEGEDDGELATWIPCRGLRLRIAGLFGG